MSSDKIPPKQAVAIKYDGAKAPQVVAKGNHELAENIIELAKQHKVFLHQDEQLVNFLQQIDLGDSIPEQLYLVIAELIAFSYIIQGKFPENWPNIHDVVDHQV